MKKHFNHKYLLLVILLIAAILRLWQLGNNPPHLTPDEAALGYSAYSILETGRDEYGNLLPIIFKSFGDYKPGLYVYTTVPSIAIFGLTEFAVRLPSAIAGVVAVWLIYKIIVIFAKQNSKLPTTNYQLLAIIAAFMLSISPWHIHFSRGAWEVNLSLTLTLAGIYFFLKAIEDVKYLFWSSLFFGLTLITYQGAKLSTLIVVVLLSLVYWKKVKAWFQDKGSRTVFYRSVLVGLVLSLPVILSFFQGQTGRLRVFSIFSHQRPPEYLEEQLRLAQVEQGSVEYNLYYSEELWRLRGIMGRWFHHFSSRFLFFEGDWKNPRHSVPDNGMLLMSDMVLLVLGIVGIRKFVKRRRFPRFVIAWLFLSPLPAILTRDEVHAVRALNMVIPLTIVLAFGAYFLIKRLRLLVLPFAAFMLFSIVYFLDSFFVHLPVHDSQYWEYGYKQAVQRVAEVEDKYEKIHVRQSFAQPYIYFLFYLEYPPSEYQKQANLIESEYGDVGRVENFDNYYFLPIDWTVNRGDFGTLFVADPVRIPPEDSKNPDEFVVEDEIEYLDGKETALRLVGVKEQEENE